MGACRFRYPSKAKYFCRCHERMGNDYYFLPSDRCLYENAKPPRSTRPTVNVREWLARMLGRKANA